MDWNLPDEEATTIAGLVIHEARSIPEPGQSFSSTASVSGPAPRAQPHHRAQDHTARQEAAVAAE